MPEQHVGATPGGVPRRGQRETLRREPRVEELNREFGQGLPLGADPVHARVDGEHRRPHFHRRQRQDRRRPAQKRGDAVGRQPPLLHGELVPPAEPPPDRRPQLALMLGPHVEERGGARPAVQVLVRAADGEVGAGALQIDRDGPDSMGKVPQRQRAGLVRQRRDRLHVGDRRAAVRDVAQGYHRHVVIEGCRHVLRLRTLDRVRLDPANVQPARRRQPLHDIAIRGEVVPVGDDRAPASPGVERRPQELVQVHGGRVGHDHLAGTGADETGADQVADARRQRHPLLVPGPDQPVGPLPTDDLLQPFQRRPRRAAEGVPVQVDDAGVRRVEPLAELGEFVRGVEGRRASPRFVRPLGRHAARQTDGGGPGSAT